MNKKKDTVKSNKTKKHFFTKLLIVVDVFAIVCFFVMYGPISIVRDWLISTAMTTQNHQWLAYIFYSEDYCEQFIEDAWISSGTQSDASEIEFKDYSGVTVYANEYEKQILEKDEGNDLYKVITIEEEDYSGFITVIYDSKRLQYVQCDKPYGNELITMCRRENAILGINASGFRLDSETENIYPNSVTINNHEIIYDTGDDQAEIIGMNDDGVLCLMTCSAQEAIDAGINWGVEFGPFLIVNGVSTKFSGRWLYGRHPRTAIGQRKDGIVLLLNIDGRGNNGSSGVTVDMLTDIFARYGCINAANLDGGGSSTLVVNDEVINYSSDGGGRYILNGIILK